MTHFLNFIIQFMYGGSDLSSLTGGSTANALSSLFSGIIVFGVIYVLVIIIGLVGLGFVLYNFTGEKKKAEEFMPRLAGYGMQAFYYIWLFIISLFLFNYLSTTLQLILQGIFPSKGLFGFGGASSFDSQSFWQTIILIAFMGAFAFGLNRLNKIVLKISKKGVDITAKMFYLSGMVTFSIILFVSGANLITSIASYNSSFGGAVLFTAVSYVVTSIGFFALYLSKTLTLVRGE